MLIGLPPVLMILIVILIIKHIIAVFKILLVACNSLILRAIILLFLMILLMRSINYLIRYARTVVSNRVIQHQIILLVFGPLLGNAYAAASTIQ